MAAESAYSMKRAIFLVPFKAIAEEKYAEFRQRYSGIGISVVLSDGDHVRFDRDIRRGDFGIAVIVYEKLYQLLIQSPGILADCSLIVIDEIQLIADPTRGPSLEMLITHLLKISGQAQLVGLSATISDLGGLDSWLNASVIASSQRPVPLWESVVSDSLSTDLENMETGGIRPALNLSSVPIPQSVTNQKLGIAYRILLAEGLDKQFLIFRTRVDDTISTARNMAHALPADPVDPEVRHRLSNLEDTPARDFLEQWIDKRVAYHNAGLSLEERELVEQLFKERVIKVLVTTSTLAAGVNTPADVVIVLDYKRYAFEQRTSLPIPVGEYKNCVGRAGRFGMTSEGHSYLVTEVPEERNLLRHNYIHGTPQTITSSMPSSSEPGILLLGLLSLNLMTTESELREGMHSSFAYSKYFGSEEERDSFVANVLESIGDLQTSGLLGNETGELTVTELGKIATSSGMSLNSFFKLKAKIEDMAKVKDAETDLISFLCQLREFQSLRPYNSEDRGKVLKEWIEGTPVSQIINKYSGGYELGSGSVRRLGEIAAWMLNTGSRIAALSEASSVADLEIQLERLAQRCKFGVPYEVAQIAELRVLHRSDLNQLVNNAKGKVLDTPHKILDTPLVDFVGILSQQKAAALQLAILDQIGESLSARKYGHCVRAEKFSNLRPLVEACYDQSGTGLEVALEQLFNSDFLGFNAYRFGKQRTGQPDLEIKGHNGNVVIQVTASEDNKKPVNWVKACTVTNSVGYSAKASNFVTIARPGFHEVAIGNANEMAVKQDQRLLLLPLSEIIELCLWEIEGRQLKGTLMEVLENRQGHYLASLDEA